MQMLQFNWHKKERRLCIVFSLYSKFVFCIYVPLFFCILLFCIFVLLYFHFFLSENTTNVVFLYFNICISMISEKDCQKFASKILDCKYCVPFSVSRCRFLISSKPQFPLWSRCRLSTDLCLLSLTRLGEMQQTKDDRCQTLFSSKPQFRFWSRLCLSVEREVFYLSHISSTTALGEMQQTKGFSSRRKSLPQYIWVVPTYQIKIWKGKQISLNDKLIKKFDKNIPFPKQDYSTYLQLRV